MIMEKCKKEGIWIDESDGAPLRSGIFCYWDAERANIVTADAGDFCPSAKFTRDEDGKKFKTSSKAVVVATPANVVKKIVKGLSETTKKFLDTIKYRGSMHFHAFFRNPSRHYRIDYYQYEECAEICIFTENNIIYRRGCENRCRILSEGIFCQVFKLVLEFFYDGSAMPKNQVKLWETLDALSSPSVPDGPVLINDEYYYLRARDLMLKRKEEIKTRLLELDDVPSKRRELRAEMKGIDYCVSILDKNH